MSWVSTNGVSRPILARLVAALDLAGHAHDPRPREAGLDHEVVGPVSTARSRRRWQPTICNYQSCVYVCTCVLVVVV